MICCWEPIKLVYLINLSLSSKYIQFYRPIPTVSLRVYTHSAGACITFKRALTEPRAVQTDSANVPSHRGGVSFVAMIEMIKGLFLGPIFRKAPSN